MDISSPGAERPTRVRWVIFILACAVSWLLYLHRYSWGLIKPAFLAENPDISPTEVGWLDSAFMAAYALGQVPGGLAGDLFGLHYRLDKVGRFGCKLGGVLVNQQRGDHAFEAEQHR